MEGKGEFLIDTNIIIYFITDNLNDNAIEFFNKYFYKTPRISVITKIELLGFDMNGNEFKKVSGFIDKSIVYNLNEKIIDKTIEFRKLYKTKLPDAIIAATSVVNNLKLITRNERDFNKISELELFNPFKKEKASK